MTADLAAFLLARIADDEAAARAAATIPQHARIPADAVIFYNGEERPARPGSWGWNGGPFRVAGIDPRVVAGLGLTDSDEPYRIVVEDAWDNDEPIGNAYFVATIPSDHDAAKHIARHDPARVLAECEAKRRIVELRYSWNLQAERNPEPPFGPILKAQVITADTIIRALAQPYADHPDWREEWAL